MEDEEKYAKRNINNVTTDTSFQSSVAIYKQKKIQTYHIRDNLIRA